jgi:hypothetical protein
MQIALRVINISSVIYCVSISNHVMYEKDKNKQEEWQQTTPLTFKILWLTDEL